MKGKILFLGILVFTAVTRLFLLNKIPPSINSSVYIWRLLSVFACLISTIVVYTLVKMNVRKKKIALLSSWIFVNLPWVFEQSRIISSPNLALTLVLLIMLLVLNTKYKLRVVFLLFIPVIFFVSYPKMWIFHASEFKFNYINFINNLFMLFSFDFLFFKNFTFWWGGVKEFGVMFTAFLPFFIVGIYEMINRQEFKLLLLIVFFGIFSALSPYFPESREFYLAVPIISFITALGIYCVTQKMKSVNRSILIFMIFLILYESAQFFHFYFIHYPQQIISNVSQIHESF
ncbi:hypothetical protein HY029_03565 [Candidatus Gottesmanbacteria bacterium]|nr:hypothetical protein [Candidatus Gottesmanbacteria bacterium]